MSTIDPLLIWAFFPHRPVFVMNKNTMSRKWVWLMLRFADIILYKPHDTFMPREVAEVVKKGRFVVMFAEGRISETGYLMKIYDVPVFVAELAKSKLIPIHIEGAQYSYHSKLMGRKISKHLFPNITILVGEPVKMPPFKDGLTEREKREKAGAFLYNKMAEMIYHAFNRERTMFKLVVDSARDYGRVGIHKRVVLEDISRKPITHGKLILATFALGKTFKTFTKEEERVGVLLPNSIPTVATLLGLQLYRRVPTMLNYSAGETALLNACKTAPVKQILTSKLFVEKGNLQNLIKALSEAKIKIVYMEDVKKQISLGIKLSALWSKTLAQNFGIVPNADKYKDPAVILFTSGSEGVPKGVVLTHHNFTTNLAQVFARVAITSQDVLFMSLPMFHSLGLIATFVPLAIGAREFLYPSPLHYKVIPELVYETDSTILFGTDTFFRQYAKEAHPYDFYNIKIAVVGAEKLKEDTKKMWIDKFGIRILEGYGVTETSPVIAINTPMHNRAGAVGSVFPGMTAQLKKLPEIEQGGLLLIKGDNVMAGYIKLDNPGVIQPPKDGWHDTGDIVEIDEDGFIFIKDRFKRFAKIGGEMVSLTAVENYILEMYKTEEFADKSAGLEFAPDYMIIAVPHDKKGEQLVLVTNNPNTKFSDIAMYAKRFVISELMVPKTILIHDDLPIFGNGKKDYITLKKRVMEELKIEA
jgi:acyl-[acyl-carrier-protein]-phospholipid O-acyltransferase/long-chain-fatty-acid--[acyl-carrier-protein] ligase